MTSDSRPTAPPEIVVGVGGGIAAYKACEIIRRLRSDVDASVTVVPTPAATQFVTAATFEALSGHPVATDVFTDIPAVAHVATGRRADLVVVAPATADLISRAAAGRADDLLTASLLVTRAPVLMAPAMHTEMWTHPATRANVATLRSRGVIVIDPAVGRLTGPDSGAGRLPDPAHITQLAELLLLRGDALPHDLAGRSIVVTAGGTREMLDPVRYLGNRSSGRQGFAIALLAAARGADVTLIAANTDLATPPGVTRIDVTDTAQLREATHTAAAAADALVMVAAVADFRPSHRAPHKIKKSPGARPAPIELDTNPDILAEAVQRRAAARRPVIAGFAAETGDGQHSVIDYGRTKLDAKGCDLLVVNDVTDGAAFAATDNAAVILDTDGRRRDVPMGPKALLGAAVCDALAERLNATD